MKLIINGVQVYLRYIHFEESDVEPAVQVRLKSEHVGSSTLHCILKRQLTCVFDGVMDNSEPDGDGFTEIRLACATFLEVIDAIRFFVGIGVAEVAPTSIREIAEAT